MNTTKYQDIRAAALAKKEQPAPPRIDKRKQLSKQLRRIPPRVAFGADVDATNRLRQRYRTGWKKLKWFPRLVSRAVTAKATQLLQEYGGNAEERTATRINDFVATYMVINHFRTLEEACETLFSQMLADGLCSRTASQYLKTAAEEFGGVGKRYRRVLKVLELLSCDDDPNHAPDRTADQCQRALVKLRKVCPCAAAMCELMMICGLRCRDIQRLRRHRIVWGTKMLRLRVRVAKNIRHSSESVVTRIPYWFGEPTSNLKELLGSKERAFENESTAKVLRALRRVDHSITTYTFRRCFMHRALIECNFDFDLCIRKYSLHKQVKTLRSYYDSLHLEGES